MSRIFGIDPSVRALGWGVIDSLEGELSCIASDTVYTNPAESMSLRLYKIQKKLEHLLEQYAPDVIALETVFLQSDLLAILKISYVRGIVMALAGARSIKLVEVAPTSVKKCLTGNGRSGKDHVREMLVHVLKLPKERQKFSSFDESDALAIAYCSAIGLGCDH
jgi:crossover junction endodeoxyribonuclease RuvC